MNGHSKGRNAKLVKNHNRSLVLKIIQQNELISRKEIALRTGLTQATITKITTELLEEEIIIEKGKDEQVVAFGRKPISLAINKEIYNIISLHIGRYVISGAVCNLAGEIIHREELKENLLQKEDDILIAELIQIIYSLMKTSELHKSKILGIGISAPGTINAEKGILIGEYAGKSVQKKKGNSTIHFDWSTIHLSEIIEEEFGIPVFADNCSNVSALAESWFGKGRGISNFVQYSVGIGIGAGVIMDGMLYRGEDDVVAEIGHITVDLNGPRCACGNTGCLELYAGFLNLHNRYLKRDIQTMGLKVLKTESREDVLDNLSKLFEEAYAGDRASEKLVRSHGEILGAGAVSLANIFSPEYIFVSSNDLGTIDLQMAVEEIQKNVEEKAFSVIAHKVKVEKSDLGEHIHLYGGVALVMQDFFNSPYHPNPLGKGPKVHFV